MATSLQTDNIGLGIWSPSDTIQTADVNSNMGILDKEISGIKVASTIEDIEITVNIADLQATIDSLPKVINHNVIINVNAGTYAGEIVIEKFMGVGTISIIGASVSGATTHNVSNVIIRENTLRDFSVEGLRATTGTAFCFQIEYNSSLRVVLNNNTATSGSSATADNYGIRAYATSLVFVNNGNVFSNKNRAIYCAYGKIITNNNSGTGNNIAYMANNGGAIHQMTSAATLTGTTLNTRSSGGYIMKADGTFV